MGDRFAIVFRKLSEAVDKKGMEEIRASVEDSEAIAALRELLADPSSEDTSYTST